MICCLKHSPSTSTSTSMYNCLFFFFNDTATTEIYTLSLHDALPISVAPRACAAPKQPRTTHRALASQHPVHEGAQEHHNAHDPVRGKKGRIEPRQVSGLHEPVLPRDQRGTDHDAAVVSDSEAGAEPEQHQRRERETVQQLGDQDGARLAEPH